MIKDNQAYETDIYECVTHGGRMHSTESHSNYRVTVTTMQTIIT